MQAYSADRIRLLTPVMIYRYKDDAMSVWSLLQGLSLYNASPKREILTSFYQNPRYRQKISSSYLLYSWQVSLISL